MGMIPHDWPSSEFLGVNNSSDGGWAWPMKGIQSIKNSLFIFMKALCSRRYDLMVSCFV